MGLLQIMEHATSKSWNAEIHRYFAANRYMGTSSGAKISPKIETKGTEHRPRPSYV